MSGLLVSFADVSVTASSLFTDRIFSLGTTHWPNARHTGSNVGKRNGEDDPHNRFEPVNKPKMDERTFKLTGIPYIKA